MKKLTGFISIFLLALITQAQPLIQTGQTTKGTNFYIGLPSDHATVKHPLIIFFHGIGEKGTNLNAVLRYGPLRQIQDGVTLSKNFTPVVIHPQVKDSFNKEFGVDVLSFAKANYNIDTTRIYLMWVSAGGSIGWNMVEDPRIVKQIAAFVSICSVSNNPARASVLVNEGIMGWCAHATNDKTVPYRNTIEMVEAVNDLAQDERIRLSDVDLWGHTIWTKFLKPEYGVYDWLKFQTLSSRIKVEVKRVTISPGDQIIIESKQ